MKVQFWGTRGSIAKAGPNTVRFGGNTSCIAVRSKAGTLVVLDCGTGAHGLGQALMRDHPLPHRGHILITHTHWDHIQGIPFFTPLFIPSNTWDIYAPRGLGPSLQEALAGQMQYTYFPVQLEGLGATIRYHDLVEGVFQIDDITVRAQYLNHPALTLGYRLEADGVTVVYACDHEPFNRDYALGQGPMGAQDRRHVAFLGRADLAIHDAQYTPEEYAQKIGWGHTPIPVAIDMAQQAAVRRLALTHHDPMRDDDALDTIVAEMRIHLRDLGSTMEVFAAAEGMVVDLVPETDDLEAAPQESEASSSATADIGAILRDRPVVLGLGTPAWAETLTKAIQDDECPCMIAPNPQGLLDRISPHRPPALVVLDEAFAGGDPAALAAAVHERQHAPGSGSDSGSPPPDPAPVVLVADRCTEHNTTDTAITDWLVAPFTPEYARTRLRAWILRSACRWVPAQEPDNEAERLAALRALAVLDTAPEERFDRLTRIAKAAFDVPIALVSLVDSNRQWFKSCIGVDVGETPRDQAFCAHAILGKTVFHIPDALQDERFADNPLVTGPARVRFYAGYPLTGPNGHALGTLCVIDTRPRRLDGEQIQLLQDLAALVEAELRTPVTNTGTSP